ncbi:protein kinase domain-containing protein [Legionella clemsonensis]|uniref:Serine/threonine-protein kinase PrkC n=1 Tax=Legionella clemsonensis TaxID=1867846 RepID=A0A222P2G8_9GAMM|nr:protein kinase [Legionella clemsonensis]ASQ46050.1 Serine/threonine-protein kinase PrkC [Legionella clemsonensis]
MPQKTLIKASEVTTESRLFSSNPDPYLLQQQEFTGGGKELGKGSYARVVEVVFRGKKAALKILEDEKTGTNEKEIMCYLAEFHNTCIVQFFGYMLCDGYYLIAMEHMAKGSIRNRIEASKEPLPWSLRLQWIKQITKGLAFLHENLIVHRDIKGANILIDEHSNAKIADFGSAVKIGDKPLEDIAGTLCWMAPEIFLQEPYDKEVDIYSLAVTFWEIVSWKMPDIEEIVNAKNLDTNSSKTSAEDTNAIEDIFTPSDTLLPFYKAILSGKRLPLPHNTPPKIAKYITWGWMGRSDERPTAGQLLSKLETHYEEILHASQPK